MKYDITHALQSLKTGAEWALRGDDYSGLEWLDKSQTKPTEDEINAKVTELNNAEPMRLLREERDRLIGQSDWRIVKAKETSTNIPAAWKTYRQALRDLPASSTPKLNSDDNLDMSSVTWPTPPS
tara:strand:- start:1 stop:375 length:375 start_codon:yes stop_codon:yes gene_type:complete